MKKNSIVLICTLIFLFVVYFSSSYFGWYGYEKWKYRRSTRGEVEESKKRNVYIKKLNYQVLPDNLNVNFTAFIEKGYFYGFHSMKETRIVSNKSSYPFQISFSQMDIKNDIYFSLNQEIIHKYDSIDRYCVYLEDMFIRDTIYIYVIKNNRDSIGIIKIFD